MRLIKFDIEVGIVFLNWLLVRNKYLSLDDDEMFLNFIGFFKQFLLKLIYVKEGIMNNDV